MSWLTRAKAGLFVGAVTIFALLLSACGPVAVSPARPLPPIPYRPIPGEPTPASQPGSYVLTTEQLRALDAQITTCEEARGLAYDLGRNEVLPSLALANRRLQRWGRWGPPAIGAALVVGIVGGLVLAGEIGQEEP